MPASVPASATSGLVHSLDTVRTKSAKADLKSPSLSIASCAVIKEALVRHYGSLKAAAITLTYDASQLTRDLDRGDFKLQRLDRDEEARAFVITALHEAFGNGDPKARVQRLIRDIRAKTDELAEAVNQ